MMNPLIGLTTDVSQVIRGVRRQPMFAVAIVVTLALGIGVPSAIYAIFNYMFFRPVPGVTTHPSALVTVSFQSAKRSIASGHSNSIPVLRTTGSAVGLDRLGYSCCGGRLAVAAPSGEQPTLQGVEFVSSQYFDALGVRSSIGRLLTDAEADSDSANVAVISSRFSRERFGGTERPLGQTIAVNGHSFVIVGVVNRFRGWGRLTRVGETDVWLPFGSQRSVTGQATMSDPVGRVKADQTLGVIEERLQAAYADLAPTLPPRYGTYRPYVYAGLFPPYREGEIPMRLYWLLMGSAALLLLLSCANAAALVLAQAKRRERNIVVRLAIGAGRWRLIRQILVESLGLAALAAVVGLAITLSLMSAFQGMRLLEYLPDVVGAEIDVRVLAFCLLLTIATVFASGLLPALLTLRPDIRGILRGYRGAAPPRHFLRTGLIVVQVALSLTLLIGAGTLNLSAQNLLATDLGIDLEKVIELELRPDDIGYNDARSAQIVEATVNALRTASFRDVALSYGNPLSSLGTLRIKTETTPQAQQKTVLLSSVSPDYFQVLRIPVLAGRTFSPAEYREDDSINPMPVVVNRRMALELFGNEAAVGRTVDIERFVGPATLSSTAVVIGVAGDTRSSAVREAPRPALYHARTPSLRYGTILIRSIEPAHQAMSRIRDIVRQVDPALPITMLRLLQDKVTDRVSEDRVLARLSALLGAIAALLCTLGVISIVSQVVGERVRDFAVRTAVGASPIAILGHAVRPVVGSSVIGIGLGLLLYWGVSRWLRARLFGLEALDTTTITMSIVALVTLLVVVALVTARATLRTDVTTLLRAE